MPNKLRALIDEQNTEQLAQYLTQNPDIDLNTVTANGASALWIALMPPKGKDISHSIVRLLIETRRIDPTQTQYATKIDQRDIPLEILREIFDYEQQYTRQQTITPNPPRQLQLIALNEQNTHDSLVVNTYDTYVKKLYCRYVVDAQKKLSWNKDILKYIDSQPNYRLNVSLANAIKRIEQNQEAREIAALGISITNAELLMLLWHAHCDNSPSSFVDGIDMSDSEQNTRKNLLLDALIDAQNTYGSNRPACFMGTRHKMIESLDKVHFDCVSSADSLLRSEHIAEMYAIHSYEAMCSLESSNPILWKEYIQYIWKDINNKELLDWIAQVRSSFLIKINQAQQSRLPAFQMQEKAFNRLVALYSDSDLSLNNQLHPKARLSEQLSTIQLFLNAPGEHLIRWVENGVASISQDDLNWRQLMKPGAIDDFYPESVLWLVLEGLFQNSPWILWLKTLPISIKQEFFKAILSRNENEDFPEESSEYNTKQVCFSSKIIHQIALEIAIYYGYWREFCIEDSLIFENKDLRGFDFSSIDLSKIIFKNCDLRLTGILSNPTLMDTHINPGNQIEKDALFIAARNNLLTALAILINRKDWEKEKSPQYIFPKLVRYMPPLFFAAESGHIEAVQLMLNKMSNDELLNFYNGFVSIISSKSEDIAIIIFQKYASSPDFFKYRCHGATIFLYALNQERKQLAEKILRMCPAVACDVEDIMPYEDDYELSALHLSLGLNSPALTNMIFLNIPTEQILNIFKKKHYSTNYPLFSAIAAKGDAYLPIISSILKIPGSGELLNMRDLEGNTVLMALAKISANSYSLYNGVISTILAYHPTEKLINARQEERLSGCGKRHTALTIAAYHKNHHFINAILQQYPTISVLNATSQDGRSVLMVAAAQNALEVVDVILECLKNSPELSSEEVINARCTNKWQLGETALTIAAGKRHLHIIKKILNHKSTEKGFNPEYSDAVLKCQNIQSETPLLVAVKIECLPVIKAILEVNSSDAVLNCQNQWGETALSTAIKQENLNIVKTILEFNSSEAVLNFKNRLGVNVVMSAIASPKVKAEIKALIREKMQSPCYLLEFQINQLKIYGEQLVSSGESQEEILAGEAAIHLASNLTRCIKAYYSSPQNTRKTQKDEINNLLRSGYQSMGEHIRPGCFHLSLMNAASCFFSTPSEAKTPIGGVSAGYLFQTTRQKEVNKIASLFEKLNPSEKPSRNDFYRL